MSRSPCAIGATRWGRLICVFLTASGKESGDCESTPRGAGCSCHFAESLRMRSAAEDLRVIVADVRAHIVPPHILRSTRTFQRFVRLGDRCWSVVRFRSLAFWFHDVCFKGSDIISQGACQRRASPFSPPQQPRTQGRAEQQRGRWLRHRGDGRHPCFRVAIRIEAGADDLRAIRADAVGLLQRPGI